jgi:ComF family protein
MSILHLLPVKRQSDLPLLTHRSPLKSSFIFKKTLEVLFPRFCLVCARKCERYLCVSCSIQPPTALDKPLLSPPAYCHSVQALYSQDESLYMAILRAKYRPSAVLARHLASLTALYAPYELFNEVNCLVPIPAASHQFRRRLFNFPELISDELSRISGIPVLSEALLRCRKTKVQSLLRPGARKINMKNAFSVNRNLNKGLRPLVIDDIITTGATVSAAAEALSKGGHAPIQAFCMLHVGKHL